MMMAEERLQDSAKHQQGFTLLEVIIALSIFAVGILAVSLMQTAALRSTSSARQRTIAASWISSHMEQIINTPYAVLTDNVVVEDTKYTVTCTVDPPVNNGRQVHLTVSWPDRGTNRSVNFDMIRVSGI
ncbi:MAG: prepilin-type N-terminal cleavage/methylation domain-containing protein [Proteobacteria bacterium]|nr:prepilin-type N-terminal cleavage/methylation domain-containing protein [Pseudomonadota bacterium]